MLRNAAASDVECLILTPHCNRPDRQDQPDLQMAYGRLCQHSKEIPVKLALGAEVHVTEALPSLIQKQDFLTLAGSRYLLTEFPFHWESTDFLPMLEKILASGYVPVVAHPERYDAVFRNPRLVYDWLDLGCHIQLTGGSVVGKYGTKVQKCADYLIKNGLVCCVASDAHGIHSRSNNLLEVQSYLSLYYSRQCARALLWENPMTIFENGTF